MAGGKGVIGAFVFSGKSGKTAELSNRFESVVSSGDDFMRIGLVPDIPDDFILGCVKYIMKGDGQFNSPQTGGKMTPFFGYDIDDAFDGFRLTITFNSFRERSFKS